MSIVRRFDENPLISIPEVVPSRDDAEVVGVFNSAAVRLGDEIILLVRISEAPVPKEGFHSTFVLAETDGRMELVRHDVPRDDPRGLNYKGSWCPHYHSHLRIARSTDGVRFTLDAGISVPFFSRYDEFGMEDPRITRIGDTFYINYSGISRPGINTLLLSTKDFERYEYHGVIFPTNNKDVAIFPETIGGRYFALHRPANGLEGPSIWIADSPDLIHWGNHEFLIKPTRGGWDEERVGCGSPPIKTPRGWLALSHGARQNPFSYCLGALLLDLNDPTQVLAYTREPFMRPETPYERSGFKPDVLFSCGHLEYPGGRVVLYYGAADDKICAGEFHVDDLLKRLI